jgi:hypothetical protein
MYILLIILKIVILVVADRDSAAVRVLTVADEKIDTRAQTRGAARGRLILAEMDS